MTRLLLALVASLTLISTSAQAALVAHFRLDGDAADATGNGNDGVVNGAVPTANRAGAAGRALRFDGSDDFVAADASGLPTADRTIAFWFYADTVANHPVLLGYGGGACGSSIFIGINATKSMYNDTLFVSSHCDANNLLFPYASPPVQQWIHLAVTVDPTGTKMYLDGSLVASNSVYITDTNVVGKALAIGVDVSPSGDAPYTDVTVGYFAGAIDDVRIYDKALSAKAIARLARKRGGISDSSPNR
ncbi:exported hypothetical protein [uncultured Defluviicoccus sp.]|uniref:LamG-like jellyroll fold domain-containing protein n=1 Tax=metagenome TaxID=256318 RepID=A0A380TF59_9ZZZZ|nr:exported hypothetical protein [uncultured Defluviicoccus sp.]